MLRDGADTGAGNVLASTEEVNLRGVPTAVAVFAGSGRGDKVSSRGRAVVENARLADRAVTRGFVLRPTPLQPRFVRSDRARTRQRAEQEAQRIITDAMAGFRTYTATVRGHGQRVDGAARLFAINTTARVVDSAQTDPDGNPLDEVMLITRLEFRRKREQGVSASAGTLTTATLVPLGAVDLTPTQP